MQMRMSTITVAVLILVLACSMTSAVAAERAEIITLALKCDYWQAKWADAYPDLPLTYFCMVADGGSPVPSSDEIDAQRLDWDLLAAQHSASVGNNTNEDSADSSEGETPNATGRASWFASFFLDN